MRDDQTQTEGHEDDSDAPRCQLPSAESVRAQCATRRVMANNIRNLLANWDAEVSRGIAASHKRETN
jgi:hypothetical protein